MPRAHYYLKGIAPKASVHDLHDLMWNCTPHPFARKGLRQTRKVLRKYLKRGGGTVEGAIAYAHDELDYDFENYRRQQGEIVSTSVAAPRPYSMPHQPAHLPTRQYSRALNKAIKFNDLPGLTHLLRTPPQGLEVGQWCTALFRQIICKPHSGRDALRVDMMQILLDSDLPRPSDLPYLALINHHYPLMALFHARSMICESDEGLMRECADQLLQGYWPNPDVWCPNVLEGDFRVDQMDRFFLTFYREEVGAFDLEKLTRLASLPVGLSFGVALSQAYGKLAASERVCLLESEESLQVLGSFLEWGWIDAEVATHANPAKREYIESHLGSARRAREYQMLTSAETGASCVKGKTLPRRL